MLYEIHMLKNYPPSNLNRDESGSPKTCYFGGTQRGRISSQCLKRAWRTSELFSQAFEKNGIRSRMLPDLVAEELSNRGMAPDMVEAVKLKVTGIANKKGDEKSELITTQVIFFSSADICAIADMMEEKAKSAGSVEAFKELKVTVEEKNKKKEKERKEEVEKRPMSMDIALFGRMVTSAAFANVEAAVQTAHAISTHTVNQESDYFSAMDELLGAEDTGAAMIGDIDYNSSCYYHYIAIDTDILAENLKNSPDVLNLIQKVLPTFVEVMAYADPSGKQNSFAGHVLPELLCVEVKDKKIPVSYANAFAQPVRFSGRTKLIEESLDKLIGEIDLLDDAFGLEKRHRAWFAPRIDKTPKNAETVKTMGELLAKCAAWAKE